MRNTFLNMKRVKWNQPSTYVSDTPAQLTWKLIELHSLISDMKHAGSSLYIFIFKYIFSKESTKILGSEIMLIPWYVRFHEIAEKRSGLRSIFTDWLSFIGAFPTRCNGHRVRVIHPSARMMHLGKLWTDSPFGIFMKNCRTITILI